MLVTSISAFAGDWSVTTGDQLLVARAATASAGDDAATNIVSFVSDGVKAFKSARTDRAYSIGSTFTDDLQSRRKLIGVPSTDK